MSGNGCISFSRAYETASHQAWADLAQALMNRARGSRKTERRRLIATVIPGEGGEPAGVFFAVEGRPHRAFGMILSSVWGLGAAKSAEAWALNDQGHMARLARHRGGLPGLLHYCARLVLAEAGYPVGDGPL